MRCFGSFAFANVISSIQDHGTVNKKKGREAIKKQGKALPIAGCFVWWNRYRTM